MAFASFDGRRAPAPMAEINMVPLIDVMLVLLVIFMVTAPLLTHAVKLDLPRADAAADRRQQTRIDFAIDAGGQRLWNGEPVSRAEAARRFTEAAAQRTVPEVHLRADRRAAYGAIAETLADASGAGLVRIAFVSQPEAR